MAHDGGHAVAAIVWDLGGVLCRFVPGRRTAAIARATRHTLSEVDTVLDHALLAALDRGEVDGQALVTLMQNRLGWDGSYDELRRAWIAAFEPNTEVLALAAAVRVSSVVLTDNGSLVRDGYRELLPDVARVLPTALFSADVGATKPDARCYHAACDRLGVAPADALFIDDSQTNVSGARSAGLRAIHYVSTSALRRAMIERRLLSG